MQNNRYDDKPTRLKPDELAIFVSHHLWIVAQKVNRRVTLALFQEALRARLELKNDQSCFKIERNCSPVEALSVNLVPRVKFYS